MCYIKRQICRNNIYVVGDVKMKKIRVALIIVVMFIAIICCQSYVQAAEKLIAEVNVSSSEVKQGETIELTFSFIRKVLKIGKKKGHPKRALRKEYINYSFKK